MTDYYYKKNIKIKNKLFKKIQMNEERKIR